MIRYIMGLACCLLTVPAFSEEKLEEPIQWPLFENIIVVPPEQQDHSDVLENKNIVFKEPPVSSTPPIEDLLKETPSEGFTITIQTTTAGTPRKKDKIYLCLKNGEMILWE